MTSETQAVESGIGPPVRYRVRRVERPIVVDADDAKSVWRQTESAAIACVQPETGAHRPVSQVKMRYDDSFVYVLFRVEDRFVRAVTLQPHGPVWEDSCVEFFFTPRSAPSSGYFNLEVNCIGTLLMRYQQAPHEAIRFVEKDDLKHIAIATSFARQSIPDEMTGPVVWTVEYALPMTMLGRYANVEKPMAGAVWHGNFNKCADRCSQPHWLSWAPIPTSRPDFHRPDCFGRLEFE